jgi:hypothetical protein
VKNDTAKSSAVYTDLLTKATFPGTVLEYIWNVCISLRTDDEVEDGCVADISVNILFADEDNQYSFGLIHRDKDSRVAVIRLPDDEDASEAWMIGTGMTQQQFDFLKLLNINVLQWQRFGMCTKMIKLSSTDIVPVSLSNGKNIALLLGGLGAIALLSAPYKSSTV